MALNRSHVLLIIAVFLTTELRILVLFFLAPLVGAESFILSTCSWFEALRGFVFVERAVLISTVLCFLVSF
jgi:hypothetical protein